MDTNTLNPTAVTVRSGMYVLNNTSATFEAQFMKTFSTAEAQLKRR